jgi:hypothetical protein
MRSLFLVAALTLSLVAEAGPPKPAERPRQVAPMTVAAVRFAEAGPPKPAERPRQVAPMTVAAVRFAERQDPAPAPAPDDKPATVADLVTQLARASADQAAAQSARDKAAQALADADSTLKARSDATAAADASIKAAVSKLGRAFIVAGTVYEPTADGYRSFTPLPAETVVPK